MEGEAMKLSEAIRLGAMFTPQTRGHLERTRRRWFFGLVGPVVLETCALGAAFLAAGCGSRQGKQVGTGRGFRGEIVKEGTMYREILTPPGWRPLMWCVAPCPGRCDGFTLPVHQMIPHLNDAHFWTREQIADWVETIEATQPVNRPEAVCAD